MILCVTLNPSWDVTHVCRDWQAGGFVRAEQSFAFPGGKGVNIGRGLSDLGHRVRNLGFAGGPAGALVRAADDAAHLQSCWIEVPGETRTNVTLFDPDAGTEIHSVAAGPEISLQDWIQLRRTFDAMLADAEFVALAGSLPAGLPESVYGELVGAARERGVRSLVDTSGEALRSAVAERPWAIKPNRDELSELVGRPLADLASAIDEARELVQSGIALVPVTLGADGAVAVTAEATWLAAAPAVSVVNSVGCGDAFAAGLLHGQLRGDSLPDQLRFAVAAGTANLTVHEPGAIPLTVNELARHIVVERLM